MKKEPINNNIADNISSIAEIRILSAKKNPDHYPKGYHRHNCYQLVIVEKGYLEIMVNCLLQRIEKNTIVMLGNDLPHGSIVYSNDIKVTLIHIPYSSVSWCASIPDLELKFRFIKESSAGYLFTSEKSTKKIIGLSKKMLKSEGFGKVSFLFELLDILSNESDIKKIIYDTSSDIAITNLKHQSPIDRTFDYIYKHYTDTFTLDEIASYAGQNPTALCRAFKKRSGFAIFSFINRIRIEQACRLLHDYELSISQIAFVVGYNSFSHFSTQFQRIVNLSPTEYRQKKMIRKIN